MLHQVLRAHSQTRRSNGARRSSGGASKGGGGGVGGCGEARTGAGAGGEPARAAAAERAPRSAARPPGPRISLRRPERPGAGAWRAAWRRVALGPRTIPGSGGATPDRAGDSYPSATADPRATRQQRRRPLHAVLEVTCARGRTSSSPPAARAATLCARRCAGAPPRRPGRAHARPPAGPARTCCLRGGWGAWVRARVRARRGAAGRPAAATRN